MPEEKPFTLDDLLEIEARYKASSANSRAYGASPWQVTNDPSDGWLVCSLGSDGEDGKDYYVTTDGVHASELDGGARPDAEFIANAPRDIKRLARAYVKLLSENVELRQKISEDGPF